MDLLFIIFNVGRAPSGRAFRCKSSFRFAPLWAFHFNPSRKPPVAFKGNYALF